MKRRRNIDAWIEEARGHLAGGRLERARVIVERVLTSSPEHAAAHSLAAAIALSEERWQAALDHLTREGSAKDAWIYFGEARALLGLGRFDEADAALRASRDLDPADPAIYELETALRREQGDLDGALSAIDGALALDPQRVSALAMRADVLLALGRDEAALDTFRAAVRSRGEGDARDRARLLRRFAEILEARGEGEEAAMARSIAGSLERR